MKMLHLHIYCNNIFLKIRPFAVPPQTLWTKIYSNFTQIHAAE